MSVKELDWQKAKLADASRQAAQAIIELEKLTGDVGWYTRFKKLLDTDYIELKRI